MVETRKTEIDCECRCCKLEFIVDEWDCDLLLPDYTFKFSTSYLGKQKSRWRGLERFDAAVANYCVVYFTEVEDEDDIA